MTTEQFLHLAFEAADNAWQSELTRVFGNRAGQVRYETGGRGDAGTPLAEIYALRMSAMRAYENATLRANAKAA